MRSPSGAFWGVLFTIAGGPIVHVRVESAQQAGVTEMRTWGVGGACPREAGKPETEQAITRATAIAVLFLIAFASTASAASAWVLWKHSYELWVDTKKVEHRRELGWKKVVTTAAKSDCVSRGAGEAHAEYHTMTRTGVRATLAGSKVGFEQRNTRFKLGYHDFECWPDSVDPRGKGK